MVVGISDSKPVFVALIGLERNHVEEKETEIGEKVEISSMNENR